MNTRHRWILKHLDITCIVYLFKTRDDMIKQIDRDFKGKYTNHNGGAFSAAYPKDKCAFVYFNEEWLLLDYISHEFFHVAYRFAIENEKGRSALSKNEEFYAVMHSEFVAQFYNKYAALPKSAGILLNDKFMAKSCNRKDKQ